MNHEAATDLLSSQFNRNASVSVPSPRTTTGSTSAVRQCDCCYCRYSRREDREAIDKENDYVIGWPELVCDSDEATESYPLRLCGFSRKSRDEIMLALLMLAKHGIRLADLNAGFAYGSESERRMEEEEDSEERIQKSVDGITVLLKDVLIREPDRETNNLRLLRVGRNFADFEVNKHVTEPAYAYTGYGEEGLKAGRGKVTWRVREMRGDEMIPVNGAAASLPEHCCVYRIFSNDAIKPMGDWEWGCTEWFAIERAVGYIEESIYRKRRARYEKLDDDMDEKWKNYCPFCHHT